MTIAKFETLFYSDGDQIIECHGDSLSTYVGIRTTVDNLFLFAKVYAHKLKTFKDGEIEILDLLKERIGGWYLAIDDGSGSFSLATHRGSVRSWLPKKGFLLPGEKNENKRPN